MNKLFLALDLPSTVRHTLTEYVPKVQERLDRQGMRWVRPEKWHVKLVDIGDQDPDTVRALVEEIVKKHQEPKLQLTRVAGLPDHKRPGTLYLGVDDLSKRLVALQSELAVALSDDEEYIPHIVLSRMKPASTKLGHKLRDFIHSGAAPEDVVFTSETVTLFNSRADGSFEKLAEFALVR